MKDLPGAACGRWADSIIQTSSASPSVEAMSKPAERLLISVYFAFVSLACIVTINVGIFHFSNHAGDSLIAKSFYSPARLLVEMLYWPARLLVVGHLDCPNADLISEKMGCIGLCLAIDLIAYATLIYLLLWLLQKHRHSEP